MIDGASCVIESRSVFPSPIDSGGLGDINHDGVPDVAYSVGNDLYLAPWNDFSNPLERRGFGGSRIIVEPLGRVDGDDIGVASNVLFVLRGDSLQTIMEIADPISPMFDFGDIDGNGEAEVIAGVPWSDGITVYGVPGGEVLLNVPFFNLATLRAQDFDGDGNSEIVFGEAQWGSVGIIDGDGTLLKSISNPSHGTTNVLVVDLHADNKQELLWGAGHTDTGSDHLYSGDLQSELVSWWSQDIDGPFQLAQPGKYLASSRSQVAVSFAESDSSYDIGGVSTLEMLNGRQIDQFLAIDGSGWGTITTVAAANVDEDQAWEICFSGDYLYDEFISCRDAISGETEWSRQIASGYIYQMLLEDIDVDGQKELLTINAWGIVSSYDASSGNLEWVSEDLTADFISWGFDGMAMVNGDLWVVFPTGNIRKLDPLSGDLVEAADATPVTHVATNGGTVYACRNGEGVGVLNPETLAFESVLYPTTGNLSLLTLADDGKTLLTASGSRPDFAPVLISVSAAFDPVLLGQMRFWDEHLTGYQHLLLTTSNGVMSISFQWLDVIFKSGFE